MSYLLDLSPLKNNRDFALLYFGQFISFIGTMITRVALPYQIYALTHSSLLVGFLSLAQLLPVLFTALLGGVFADRYNRRKLVILSEIILMLGCALLTFNAYSASPNLVFIFIISPCMSAINGLHRPAFESMNQQLIKPAQYKAVGALSSFKFSFCMITGPAIAGLLIAQYGLVITYFIDLITFLISLISLCCMRRLTPIPPKNSSILSELKDGITFAFKRQELIGSYAVDIIAMLFVMPTALFPALAHTFGGVKTLGLLYAAPAVGALFVSFFSRWTARIKQDGKAIAIAAGLSGVAIIGFGLSRALWPALFCLALFGALDAISGIFRSTLWNNTIPTEYRGRLAGIEMISYISGPHLGDMRAGFMATGLSIPIALVSGGIFCVLGVGLCCIYMPKFWKYHAP